MQVLTMLWKKIIKGILLSLFLFPAIFLLNNGFAAPLYWQVIQASIFTLTLIIIILRPQLRVSLFYTALGLIILTGLLYITRLMVFAEMAGSTGVGLILLNLISYLPQLVKLGYIKNL